MQSLISFDNNLNWCWSYPAVSLNCHSTEPSLARTIIRKSQAAPRRSLPDLKVFAPHPRNPENAISCSLFKPDYQELSNPGSATTGVGKQYSLMHWLECLYLLAICCIRCQFLPTSLSTFPKFQFAALTTGCKHTLKDEEEWSFFGKGGAIFMRNGMLVGCPARFE